MSKARCRSSAVLASCCLALALGAVPLAAQTVDLAATPTTSGSFPLDVQFTSTVTGGTPTLYLWQFGDGGSSTDPHPSHTYAVWGDYTVSLTVFFGALPVTEKQVDLIHVGGGIEADFGASPPVGVNHATVQFTDTSVGAPAESWLWELGDGTTSTGPAPLHEYLHAGSYDVSLTVTVGGKASTRAVSGAVQVGSSAQPGPVLAEGDVFEGFGTALVRLDDRLAIGVPNGGSAGHRPGEVLWMDPVAGTLLATLVADDGGDEDRFGEALAMSATHLAVGAPQDDDLGSDSGSAYVFDALTGTQLQKLHGVQTETGDRFGDAVALSDTLVLVGAPYESHAGGFTAGAAYLFDLATGQQLHRLVGDDTNDNDRFGTAVALHGSRAFVSAPQGGGLPGSGGTLYVFDIATGAQIDTLHGQPVGVDVVGGFGSAIAVDEERMLVGARFSQIDGARVGSAYLFDLATGEQLREFVAPGGVDWGGFGASVALGDGFAAVGAPEDPHLAPGDGAGAVELFDLETGAWLLRLPPELPPEESHWGLAVTAAGDEVIASSLGASGLAAPPALVQRFDVGLAPWEVVGQALAGAGGAPHLAGFGPLTAGEMMALDLGGAAPAAPCALVVGFSVASLPFKGGVLVPSPDVVLAGFATNPLGQLQIVTSFPAGVGAAQTFVFQCWIVDASGPSGFTASNGLGGTTP